MAQPRRPDRKRKDRLPDRAPPPEFSRPVDVSRIGRLEHRAALDATAEERAALARRFDLLHLAELTADLVLKKRGDGVIELSGPCRARLAQASVVSLEPVWSTLEDRLQVYFGNAAETGEERDPLDEEAWPEPIEGGQVDLGEAVSQWLAVVLEPYPRLPEER